MLSSKHGVVTRRPHQKQERERQHEVRSRYEETLSRQILRLVGDRRAMGRIVGRPSNDFLLRAPDYSPDVEHHHPAHASSNADGEQAIALPAVIVEAQEQ